MPAAAEARGAAIRQNEKTSNTKYMLNLKKPDPKVCDCEDNGVIVPSQVIIHNEISSNPEA
ncbi:MAG: hypothetical protein C0402_13350 [Thermodesulfovibrio sp.]|nr:hypothetical protein [Thermodesulfovibrio sp.]